MSRSSVSSSSMVLAANNILQASPSSDSAAAHNNNYYNYNNKSNNMITKSYEKAYELIEEKQRESDKLHAATTTTTTTTTTNNNNTRPISSGTHSSSASNPSSAASSARLSSSVAAAAAAYSIEQLNVENLHLTLDSLCLFEVPSRSALIEFLRAFSYRAFPLLLQDVHDVVLKCNSNTRKYGAACSVAGGGGGMTSQIMTFNDMIYYLKQYHADKHISAQASSANNNNNDDDDDEEGESAGEDAIKQEKNNDITNSTTATTSSSSTTTSSSTSQKPSLSSSSSTTAATPTTNTNSQPFLYQSPPLPISSLTSLITLMQSTANDVSSTPSSSTSKCHSIFSPHYLPLSFSHSTLSVLFSCDALLLRYHALLLDHNNYVQPIKTREEFIARMKSINFAPLPTSSSSSSTSSSASTMLTNLCTLIYRCSSVTSLTSTFSTNLTSYIRPLLSMNERERTSNLEYLLFALVNTSSFSTMNLILNLHFEQQLADIAAIDSIIMKYDLYQRENERALKKLSKRSTMLTSSNSPSPSPSTFTSPTSQSRSNINNNNASLLSPSSSSSSLSSLTIPPTLPPTNTTPLTSLSQLYMYLHEQLLRHLKSRLDMIHLLTSLNVTQPSSINYDTVERLMSLFIRREQQILRDEIIAICNEEKAKQAANKNQSPYLFPSLSHFSLRLKAHFQEISSQTKLRSKLEFVQTEFITYVNSSTCQLFPDYATRQAIIASAKDPLEFEKMVEIIGSIYFLSAPLSPLTTLLFHHLYICDMSNMIFTSWSDFLHGLSNVVQMERYKEKMRKWMNTASFILTDKPGVVRQPITKDNEFINLIMNIQIDADILRELRKEKREKKEKDNKLKLDSLSSLPSSAASSAPTSQCNSPIIFDTTTHPSDLYFYLKKLNKSTTRRFGNIQELYNYMQKELDKNSIHTTAAANGVKSITGTPRDGNGISPVKSAVSDVRSKGYDSDEEEPPTHQRHFSIDSNDTPNATAYEGLNSPYLANYPSPPLDSGAFSPLPLPPPTSLHNSRSLHDFQLPPPSIATSPTATASNVYNNSNVDNSATLEDTLVAANRLRSYESQLKAKLQSVGWDLDEDECWIHIHEQEFNAPEYSPDNFNDEVLNNRRFQIFTALSFPHCHIFSTRTSAMTLSDIDLDCVLCASGGGEKGLRIAIAIIEMLDKKQVKFQWFDEIALEIARRWQRRVALDYLQSNKTTLLQHCSSYHLLVLHLLAIINPEHGVDPSMPLMEVIALLQEQQPNGYKNMKELLEQSKKIVKDERKKRLKSIVSANFQVLFNTAPLLSDLNLELLLSGVDNSLYHAVKFLEVIMAEGGSGFTDLREIIPIIMSMYQREKTVGYGVEYWMKKLGEQDDDDDDNDDDVKHNEERMDEKLKQAIQSPASPKPSAPNHSFLGNDVIHNLTEQELLFRRQRIFLHLSYPSCCLFTSQSQSFVLTDVDLDDVLKACNYSMNYCIKQIHRMDKIENKKFMTLYSCIVELTYRYQIEECLNWWFSRANRLFHPSVRIPRTPSQEGLQYMHDLFDRLFISQGFVDTYMPLSNALKHLNENNCAQSPPQGGYRNIDHFVQAVNSFMYEEKLSFLKSYLLYTTTLKVSPAIKHELSDHQLSKFLSICAYSLYFTLHHFHALESSLVNHQFHNWDDLSNHLIQAHRLLLQQDSFLAKRFTPNKKTSQYMKKFDMRSSNNLTATPTKTVVPLLTRPRSLNPIMANTYRQYHADLTSADDDERDVSDDSDSDEDKSATNNNASRPKGDRQFSRSLLSSTTNLSSFNSSAYDTAINPLTAINSSLLSPQQASIQSLLPSPFILTSRLTILRYFLTPHTFFPTGTVTITDQQIDALVAINYEWNWQDLKARLVEEANDRKKSLSSSSSSSAKDNKSYKDEILSFLEEPCVLPPSSSLSSCSSSSSVTHINDPFTPQQFDSCMRILTAFAQQGFTFESYEQFLFEYSEQVEEEIHNFLVSYLLWPKCHLFSLVSSPLSITPNDLNRLRFIITTSSYSTSNNNATTQFVEQGMDVRKLALIIERLDEAGRRYKNFEELIEEMREIIDTFYSRATTSNPVILLQPPQKQANTTVLELIKPNNNSNNSNNNAAASAASNNSNNTLSATTSDHSGTTPTSSPITSSTPSPNVSPSPSPSPSPLPRVPSREKPGAISSSNGGGGGGGGGSGGGSNSLLPPTNFPRKPSTPIENIDEDEEDDERVSPPNSPPKPNNKQLLKVADAQS